jgi:hypothetical protein
MATLKIRVFTNPDGLKRIANVHLIALLDPWRKYFAGRGVEIPTDPGAEFPHHDLASALMSYDENMPVELMNGLFYIDETASNETLDDLIDRGKEESIAIEKHGKSTPADIAVQIWLAKPQLLEERHTKALALQKQAFVYFPGKRRDGLELPQFSQPRLTEMAKRMDRFFEERQRGRGTRIFEFPRPKEKKVWLLVRHGMPMTREGKHEEDGETGVAFYRPQKHDVMIYDAAIDVLGINAQSKGEKTLYGEVLGEVVFGKKGYFGEGNIFTLAPIRNDGPKIQECGDIDGIDQVRLLEVVRVIGGDVTRIDIQKSSDLYRALRENWSTVLKFGRITSAKFGFVFEGSSKQRSVTIRLDSARYDRDSDAEFVEAWLRDKKFYTPTEEEDVIDEDDDAVATA